MSQETLFIFAYAGKVGAESDLENGTFLNKPLEKGQLGVVVPLENVVITQDAIDAIKEFPRAGGSFADIMLMPESFGLIGHGKHLPSCISRDCDLSVLDKITVTDKEVPEDFKEFVCGNKL